MTELEQKRKEFETLRSEIVDIDNQLAVFSVKMNKELASIMALGLPEFESKKMWFDKKAELETWRTKAIASKQIKTKHMLQLKSELREKGIDVYDKESGSNTQIIALLTEILSEVKKITKEMVTKE